MGGKGQRKGGDERGEEFDIMRGKGVREVGEMGGAGKGKGDNEEEESLIE